MDIKKEILLKKIFNVTDMQPIYNKVLEDWADFTISTKYQNVQTIDEKIAVLEAKEKPEKPIKIGAIKTKKLK